MASIWIIDDDVEFAENTAAILAGEGHAVHCLHTTDGAVEALVDAKPDILVLDVMFPDDAVAGIRFARRIRRTREIDTLPIILLTAVNQEFPAECSPDDADSPWMPVQAFVEKPVKKSALLRAIGDLLKAGE